jgi:hypothetical protein
MSKAGRLFQRLNFGNFIKKTMRPSDLQSFEILPTFLDKIDTFMTLFPLRTKENKSKTDSPKKRLY